MLKVIRQAIEQRFEDDRMCKQSAWVRSVIPPDVDVATVFKILTSEGSDQLQLIAAGLMHLSLPPSSPPPPSVSRLVLLRLARAQPDSAPRLLAALADRLAAAAAAATHGHYADCLYILCKMAPLSVQRCTQLTTIVENCRASNGDYKAAAAVLEATHPLLNFSTRLRDTMLCVCRKGLYSRDSIHRCLALSGFLTVLRHMKLAQGSMSSSQSLSSERFSAHSYLTQLTVDLHCTSRGEPVTSKVRNEAMCMEVVSILRRCLLQDAVVKQLLYSKIYDCAKEKPVLHESILEMLYEQLSKYLREDDGGAPLDIDKCVQTHAITAVLTKPVLHESMLEMLYEQLSKYLREDDGGAPLDIDKCVQTHAITAVLTEPIGALLYAVAQFIQPQPEETLQETLGSQGRDPGPAHLCARLCAVMDTLCRAENIGSVNMLVCVRRSSLQEMLGSQGRDPGPAHLCARLCAVMDTLCRAENIGSVNMEDPGISDLTPESKAKSLKVQQMLQCYSALIAHTVMQWSVNENAPATVYSLFKRYSALLEKTKTAPKIGKKASKSTLNDTKETAKSQKSQKTQKEKGKAPIKLSNLVKDRAGPFKPLPCLWDLRFCNRMMQLLYSTEVPWSTVDQLNAIRSRRDFHHWSLRSVQCALTAEPLHRRRVPHHVLPVAEILYSRCVARYQEMCDFDDQTAVLCLELFKDCLNIILSEQYSFKIEKILPAITGTAENNISDSVVAMLQRFHNALETLNDDAEEEAADKRSIAAITQVASVVLSVPGPCSEEYSAMILQLEDFVRRCKIDCLSLVPALLAANCRLNQDAQFLDDLLMKVLNALGRIDIDCLSLVPALLAANCRLNQDAQFLDDLLVKVLNALGRIDYQDFVRRCKIDCLSLVPALLAANCRLNQDAQFLDDLLMKVLNALGRIDEEDTSADDDTTTFPSIDARTGHAVFQHLCTHAAGCLKHCGHLLARTRDLQAAGCVPPPATLQIHRAFFLYTAYGLVSRFRIIVTIESIEARTGHAVFQHLCTHAAGCLKHCGHLLARTRDLQAAGCVPPPATLQIDTESIEARSGHTVFQHLCTHAAGCLKHCGHLMARTRDLQAAGCVPPPATLQIDTQIQATNKAIVTQLTQISVWAARLSSARCSVGAGSDKVLSLCINLYTHLTTAVKRCHTARLEPLLKVSGKKLSSCIDNTISYVESSVQPSPSRVLRDTKLIPRLVLRAEQYQHALHEHAHKHKLNWSHYLSLGTARDFRIKAPALQEALARDADDSREHNDEEPGINDAETTLPTPEASDEENDDPARKKRRVS
ncbi:unnamed protein product [Plutella xylostella]|uniref:(diamondback moth) hypothetical protein n=1 Tax=Plutella xylostella TaxID=51655 RepID=A0A8S4D7M3_PLUXY|nr:unnamed protein product [Plutella xylostella]